MTFLHAELLRTDMRSSDILRDIYLGRVSSDWKEGDQTAVATLIDSFVTDLEIDAQDWQASFLGGHVNSDFYQPLRHEQVGKFRTDGKSLGEYVVDTAYWALPIEENDEGEGYLDISLAAGPDHVVRLHSEGYCQTLYPEADEPDQESAVYYYIGYTAMISQVSP